MATNPQVSVRIPDEERDLIQCFADASGETLQERLIRKALEPDGPASLQALEGELAAANGCDAGILRIVLRVWALFTRNTHVQFFAKEPNSLVIARSLIKGDEGVDFAKLFHECFAEARLRRLGEIMDQISEINSLSAGEFHFLAQYKWDSLIPEQVSIIRGNEVFDGPIKFRSKLRAEELERLRARCE